MQSLVPTSTPQCDVDPAGDLILLVGQGNDQKPIRVSSKVLSLASPVFATMFGPRYLEGHVLSKQTKSSIPSFPLPDDHPEAMTWFCRAVHLQMNADVLGKNVSLMLKIAALCDKYDASTALSGWTCLLMERLSCLMLRDLNTPRKTPAMRYCVLHMSYAFKNHRTFWLSTRNIMHHSSLEGIRWHKDRSKHSILPTRLYYSIEIECRTTLLAFQRAIEQVISRYAKHQCSPNHRAHREMCGVLTLTGHYFQELSRLGLWPMADLELPEGGSFSQLKEKISQFEPCDIKTLRTSKNACLISIIDIKEALHMAAEEIHRNRKGLCLRCVTKGRFMVSEGNCEAEFHDSCTGKDR